MKPAMTVSVEACLDPTKYWSVSLSFRTAADDKDYSNIPPYKFNSFR